MRPYIVRQGDHLASIAARHGFDADEVWNHDRNRDLRERRDGPQVLAPGDLLYVPEREPELHDLTPQSTNRFTASFPTVRVNLVLDTGNGRAANEPYRVEGMGPPQEGQSDGEGKVELDVPVHLSHVRLVLPNLHQSVVLRIGHLDPPTHDSGVAQRLRSLGYLPPRDLLPPRSMTQRDRDAELARAVARFQRDQGLEESGEVDARTRDALREAHGA